MLHIFLIIIYTIVGIVSGIIGFFVIGLHGVYVRKAKKNKKRAGKIYLLSGELFFSLGISEILFVLSFYTNNLLFGKIGYLMTAITMILAVIVYFDLKRYPDDTAKE